MNGFSRKHFWTLVAWLNFCLMVSSGAARADVLNSYTKVQTVGGRISFSSSRGGAMNMSIPVAIDGVTVARKVLMQPAVNGKANFTITESSTRALKKCLCKSGIELDFLNYDRRRNEHVRFTQSPGGSLVLEVGTTGPKILDDLKDLTDDDLKPKANLADDGDVRTYKANSIWEMVMVVPDSDLAMLNTLFASLHKDLKIVGFQKKIMEALVQEAKLESPPERSDCHGLIEQLASDEYATRQAATRELEKLGGQLIVYLVNLDWDTLEPEQQLRLKRIREHLEKESGQQDVELYAKGLVQRPAVWVTILESSDKSQRKQAVVQLEKLLGERIDILPDEMPENQKDAIQALRDKIGSKK